MKITTKTGDKGETSLFGGRRVSKASRIIEVLGELDELQAVIGWCGVAAGHARTKFTDKSAVTSRRLQVRGLRAEAGTDGSVVTSQRLQKEILRAEAGRRGDFIKILTRIEDDLYRIMSIVGFEFKCPKNIKPIGEADVKRLEKKIREDEALVGAELKTAGKRENLKRLRRFCGPFLLKEFVRPGGSEISARLHIARTVCRRAERRMAGMECGTKSIPGNGFLCEQGETENACLSGRQGCAVFILKYLNRLSDLLFVMACAG